METQLRKVRRAPNIVAFLVTGGLLGCALGTVIALIGPDNPQYGGVTTWALFAVVFAGLGVLVAGIIMVLLDQRSVRRNDGPDGGRDEGG